MKKAEIIIDVLAVCLISGFLIFAGLELLFGAEENRLARNRSTLVPALGWALAMWVFLSLVFFMANRIVFATINTLSRIASNQSEQDDT
ncbi:hypothetical protein [Coraliomargarita akajimensis]|uniref:hypothetical protein n=1 Tax=Coraliomargarita akajimensis TaxID=395922 RepID=UPI0005A129EB|nr:hypothetical protein [Coraliomargarita akajimensis]